MSTRRTAALVVHLLAEVLRTQRVLVPAVLYAALVGLLLIADHRTAPGPWAASALALYPTAAWVAVVVAGVEARPQRSVTIASVGGSGRVVLATTLAAVVLDLPLAVLGGLTPCAVNPAVFPLATGLLGALAHLGVALAGTTVGLTFAPPVTTRTGYSFALTALTVLLTATLPAPVPVAPIVRALDAGTTAVGPLLGGVATAVGLLAVVAVGTWAVARRR